MINLLCVCISVKLSKIDTLNNTAAATSKLSEVSVIRNNIVQDYYKEKLEILKRQTDLKERSVIAKEKIAIALSLMAGLKEDGVKIEDI